MITIDCNNVKPIKHQLPTYIADRLCVLPILKSEKFILTPIEDNQRIEKSDVLTAIEKFLESIDQRENIQITLDEDYIKIEPLDGKEMKKPPVKKKEIFFECTHCGFMTQYEVEWRTHKMIHYI